MENKCFEIMDLEFFDRSLGWRGILNNSKLCDEYKSEEPDWLKELEKMPIKKQEKRFIK